MVDPYYQSDDNSPANYHTTTVVLYSYGSTISSSIRTSLVLRQRQGGVLSLKDDDQPEGSEGRDDAAGCLDRCEGSPQKPLGGL